jgi:flagellar biosynthetic protein FliO
MAEDPGTLALLVRLTLSLGVVLGLVGAITWVLRRQGLLRPAEAHDDGGRLQIVDRKSLGRNSSLVVARFGGTTTLLGVTTERIQMLATMPDHGTRSEPGPACATPPALAELTVGVRRTGLPAAGRPAARTRMGLTQALQELTVRRS